MPTDSKFNLNVEFVAESTAGEVVQGHGIEITHGTVIDSRKVKPGDLFVPLQGENTDGHSFLSDALERGASGVLIAKSRLNEFTRILDNYKHRSFAVAVTDPLAAMQDLAAAWLKLLKTTVIGVTGSVGKTTTKGLINAGLAGFGPVKATPGNYNNAIGLPLSVLTITPADIWTVLEYGTSGFGEITFLSGIARPKIAVITGVSGSHLQTLKDLDGVARAKAELVKALPKGGTAILNADDPRVRAMAEYADNVIFFGRSEDADIRILSVHITRDMKTFCKLSAAGEEITVKLNLLGLQHAGNFAAAVGVAMALGLDVRKFANACQSFKGEPMRMEVLRTPKGIVVNDAYNSSLTSIIAALSTLAQVNRPITVVLGDVLETGTGARELHREIGRAVAHSNAKLFVALGEKMAIAADAAVQAGMDKAAVHLAIDHKQASELVLSLSEKQPIVLVKGSRGMKMELIAKTLKSIWNINNPEPNMEQ